MLEYKGRILSGGHRSCPKKVKKHLDLFSGSLVKQQFSVNKCDIDVFIHYIHY
ncbi:MAG: hypothetical protein ABIJ30_08640 [bacterium]